MMVMMEVPMLEAGKDRCKMPHMTACEPSCAIFHRGSAEPLEEVLHRNAVVCEGRKKKQEKALAVSVRQGEDFCPQCGQLRGQKLTLFWRSEKSVDADISKGISKPLR